MTQDQESVFRADVLKLAKALSNTIRFTSLAFDPPRQTRYLEMAARLLLAHVVGRAPTIYGRIHSYQVLDWKTYVGIELYMEKDKRLALIPP